MTRARILVVDDDRALREAIAEVLSDQGYEVSCAGNGADALAQLERGPLPSVILLDLAMPVMDGWAFRRFQQADPRLDSVPTVVVSANYEPDDDGALASLHPTAFLPKPFDLDRLIEAIRQVC